MGWIYALISPCGKVYVGQTIRKRVYDRWRAHKNRAFNGTGACRALNNAIRKYGWENFEKRILEEVDDDSMLNERERWWIAEMDSFANGYNLTEGGDENPMVHQSTRDRLKRTLNTPESRAKRSKNSKAYHEDPEKHADWLQKNTVGHQTAECRAKISANNRKVWAKEGEREKRGSAIRDALNTDAMKASKAKRDAKMIETKAKQYEAKLAALPPEEAARRRKASEKTARNRAIRKARMQSAPIPGRSTPATGTSSGSSAPIGIPLSWVNHGGGTLVTHLPNTYTYTLMPFSTGTLIIANSCAPPPQE